MCTFLRIFYIQNHIICKVRGQNLQGIFDRSDKSGHTGLVPDLREKAFCSPVSMMLVVGFSWMLFTKLRNFLSIPNLMSVFIKKDCWELSNAFYLSTEMIM